MKSLGIETMGVVLREQSALVRVNPRQAVAVRAIESRRPCGKYEYKGIGGRHDFHPTANPPAV